MYPVLAFGVERPSRAPLVTGVRAHVDSLEVGMMRGMKLLQQVTPLYAELKAVESSSVTTTV